MKAEPEISDLALNLWAYIDESSGMVYAISGRVYALAGKDEDKFAFLRQLAGTDYLTAKRHALPKNFTVTDGQQTHEGMMHPKIIRDNMGAAFEGLFRTLESELPPIPDFLTEKHTPQRIPQEPLYVLTFLREDEEGNITALTSRDLSREFAIEQAKKEMMQMGFSDPDAEAAARQWAAEQDRQQ